MYVCTVNYINYCKTVECIGAFVHIQSIQWWKIRETQEQTGQLLVVQQLSTLIHAFDHWLSGSEPATFWIISGSLTSCQLAQLPSEPQIFHMELNSLLTEITFSPEPLFESPHHRPINSWRQYYQYYFTRHLCVCWEDYRAALGIMSECLFYHILSYFIILCCVLFHDRVKFSYLFHYLLFLVIR